MDRREFLSGTTLRVPNNKGQDFSKLTRTQTGLAPYNGTWSIREVRHLLKRTLFGNTLAEINYFLAAGRANAVSELIEQINHPAYSPPSLPLNNYSGTYSDPNCAAGQAWPGTPDSIVSGITSYNLRRKSLKSWWISQLLNQPKSIREKMVLFWHNHFVIELDTVQVSTYVYKYNELLREHALGNFKNLTKEMTINCAMLKYLNGDRNTAQAPNENYARELQELFTIGKDAGGNTPFTEDDVKAAARVLTGWRTDLIGFNSANGFNSYFDGTRHDAGAKVFSAYYGNTVISGRSGAAGVVETDELLDMIFSKDEVALTICRKLYNWFVYYDIDPATEANVIVPLAAIFRASNYDIVPVLSALFNSEHFFDVLNQACLIKSPVDMSVGMCREFGVVFPDAVNLAAQYSQWDRIRTQASSFQQDIGDPPNVAGWLPYYQAPLYHEAWINSDTLPKRNQFTDRMISSGYTTLGTTIKINVVAYTETLTNPSDPLALIEEVLALHYSIDTGQNLRNYLLSILLSGQSSNSYWTTAWDDYVSNPGNTGYYNIVNSRLKSFYTYLLDLSEYQLS